MRYNVEVTCITDNPSINSKVEVIEAKSLDAARDLAEYLFGPSRIVKITVDRFTDPAYIKAGRKVARVERSIRRNVRN